MVMANTERIAKALDLLRDGLRPCIQIAVDICRAAAAESRGPEH